MKLNKKLLALKVNSVRPYKSRLKRPCDFCRRRKTCCIIENLIPCMACVQFNKGECTFEQGPLKRNNRKNLGKVRRKRDDKEYQYYPEDQNKGIPPTQITQLPTQMHNPQLAVPIACQDVGLENHFLQGLAELPLCGQVIPAFGLDFNERPLGLVSLVGLLALLLLAGLVVLSLHLYLVDTQFEGWLGEYRGPDKVSDPWEARLGFEDRDDGHYDAVETHFFNLSFPQALALVTGQKEDMYG